MKKPLPLTLRVALAELKAIGELIVAAITSPKSVKSFKGALAVAVLAALAGCGSRSALRVPTEAAVTFQRSVMSSGAWRWRIFQAAPSAGTPEGRAFLDGVDTFNHAAHPGGEWLAFTTREGLFVQDRRGNRVHRSSDQYIGGIEWSPDARRLAFTKDGRVWVMDAVGGGAATPLTPEQRDPTEVAATDPSWAPDGSRLYFIRFRGAVDGRGDPIFLDFEVWTVAADGSDLRLVHAGEPLPSLAGLAVSRDGASVVYGSGNTISQSIVRLDLASGATTTLVANARGPAFSESGRYMAFTRGGQVWVCAYDGNACTGERQISNGTLDHTLSWVGW